MQIKMYVAMFGAVVIGNSISSADKRNNYIKTQAVVTSAEVDCYVEDSNSKIVEKSTGDLAYMDCMMAPIAAQMHGHTEADVKKRVKFAYKYTSPVDGSLQSGDKTVKSGAFKYDEEGKTFTIYAHKSKPAKRRF